MTIRRILAIVLSGGVLALVAWVYVLAQQPRNPSVAVGFADAPPRLDQPQAIIPALPPTTTSNPYQSFASPPASVADTALPPVKVQLRKGLALDGQLAVSSGRLMCAAAFGEVAIPLTAIRGIRFHEEAAAAGAVQPAPQATIILTNNDSLTVSLRAAHIQVKTEWGEANINVPHLQSLLLNSDDVQWQEAGGRWTLVAAPKPAPADTHDSGSTAPVIPRLDNADAAPSLEPGPTVPPADTRQAAPPLPAVNNPN